MITAAYLLAVLLFFALVAAALLPPSVSGVGPDIRPLLRRFLVGSLLVGVSYLLVLVLFSPGPSTWNFVWVAAIPVAVAAAHRRRVSSLALAVPLFVGGWVTSALMAWALRIPIG